MPPYDLSESALQNPDIQGSIPADRYWLVVNRELWNKLGVKPNLLLGKRQRRHIASQTRNSASTAQLGYLRLMYFFEL